MKLLEIVNIKTYDPSTLRDDQLRDDWRIVMAWYATLKDPEREIRHSEEEIVDTAEKVLKELVVRWKKDNDIIMLKPREMQPTSRDLFAVVRELVAIPEEMIQEAMDLIAITPTTVATMTLEKLIELDKQLHELWEAYEQGVKINREDLVNAHLFVLNELKTRGHRHVAKDGLDRETEKLLESEPPHYDTAAAKRVADSLPDQIVLAENFVEVVGDWLDPEKATSELPTFDLDIKLARRDPNVDLKLQRICLKATNRFPRLSFLPDGIKASRRMGLYDMVLRKKGFEIRAMDELGFKADYYESGSECASRVRQLFDGARDFVFVPDFVSITGGFLYHRPDRKPNDLDVILRSYYRDPKMEAELKSAIRKACDLDVHWVYETRGPNWDHMPIYDLVLAKKRDINIVEVDTDQVLEEGMRPAFGLPGGKKLLAGQITSYIPDHKIYVEPFAGGGAVFFKKKPSEKEVLNDKDGDIATAYRFIKQITSQDVTNLGKRLLTFSRKQFFSLKDSKPTSPFDRFYKFLYLSAFSFGQSRDTTVSSVEGIGTATLRHKLDRLELVKERLKNVAVYNADFRKVIKKYDSKETFFYFDPPYPEQQGKLKTDLTVEEIGDAFSKVKGKWILSMPNKPEARKLARKFHFKRVQGARTFNQRTGERHDDPELLISNFPLQARKIWLAEAEKPSPRELERLKLEKQIGDWYMIVQPKGKSFASTVQQHVRGVWTDAERDEFLDRIRDLRKEPDDKMLKKLWRDMDASALRVPFETLKKRAQKVSDENGNVTAEVDRWTEDKPPSAKRFLEWYDRNIIVNRASTHVDLRMTEPGGKHLVGWTGNTPGSSFQFLKGGKVADVLRNKFMDYKAKDNILSQKKCENQLGCNDHLISIEKLINESVQPLTWLTIVTPRKPVFWAGPGQVGATEETAGLIRHLADMKVVYGTQKTDYHEYFLFFKDPALQRKIGGRWGWQLIGGREEYKKAPAEQFWTANRPEEQRPYVMTHKFDKELEKARSDKIDLVWNFDTVETLEKMNYFKGAGLKTELAEWQETAEKPEKEQFWFRTRKPPEVKARESEKIICENCNKILGITDNNNRLTIKWGELKASFKKEDSTISCRHCGKTTQMSP